MDSGAQEVYAPIMSETEIYLICEQSMPTILNSDRTDVCHADNKIKWFMLGYVFAMIGLGLGFVRKVFA